MTPRDNAALATRSGPTIGARPARHGAGRDHRRRRGPGRRPRPVTVTHPTAWSVEQVAALADAVRPVVPGGGVLQLIPERCRGRGGLHRRPPVGRRRGGRRGRRGRHRLRGRGGGPPRHRAGCAEPAGRTRPYRRRPVRRRRAAARRPRRGRRRHRAEPGDDPAGPDRPGSAAPRLPPRQGGPVHRQGRHRSPPTCPPARSRSVSPAPRSTTPSAPGPRPWSRRSAAPWAASRPTAGLQAVVLTGGCTQIPLLQRLLARAASGPLEVARFAAARGAAILAAPALSDAPAGTAR